MDINANSLNNESSLISAVDNITINAEVLNNHTNSFESYTKYVGNWWGYWNCDGDCQLDGAAKNNYHFESYPGMIKTGGNFVPYVTNDVSNGEVIENSRPDIDSKNSQYVNGIDVDDLNKNGVLNVNIINYINGPDNQGLFTKNPNPNGPLFESRSQFVDQSKFFGSNYFYQRIGLDLTQ